VHILDDRADIALDLAERRIEAHSHAAAVVDEYAIGEGEVI
jgi:hypothetical protein